jgi:exodeoxyribonuclease VII small subunit
LEHSFEDGLRELEQIVHELEDGGLGLAESLARYEQGVQHLRRCYQALKQAEQKIEQLAGVDAQGNAVAIPFDDRPAAGLGDAAGEVATSHPKKPAKTPREVRKSPPGDDVDAPPTLF